MAKQTLPHHAQRIDFAVGAADQEEVGLVAPQNARRLSKSQQAGDFAFRDRVVRSLGVVQDRDVAGMHVGQIFEHPERRNGGQPLLAPQLEIDRRLAVGAYPGRAD